MSSFAIRACSFGTVPPQLEHPLQPQELPPEMILPSRRNLTPVSDLFVHGVSLNLGIAIEIPAHAKCPNLVAISEQICRSCVSNGRTRMSPTSKAQLLVARRQF